MKIQIDSVTFITDSIDDDGERQIVIKQYDAEVLLNDDNILQLSLIIEKRLSELSCCTIVE